MSTRPDHYMPADPYERLVTEIAGLPLNTYRSLDSTFCPRTWAIEILGLACIWPDSIAPELEDTAPALTT